MSLFINWNPSPTLLHLEPLQIRYYGLLFMIGFYVARLVLKYAFEKDNKPLDKLSSLLTYVIVSTLVGARLGHVFFYDWAYFKNHPLEILLPFRFEPNFEFTGFSGLASHGAVIGIAIAVVMFCNKNKMFSTGWLFDHGSIAAIGAGTLIRLGNFMNSEILGKVVNCDFPFAIRFLRGGDINTFELLKATKAKNLEAAFEALNDPNFASFVESVPCRHPVQLYESLGYALIFLILWLILTQTNKSKKTGFIFGMFLILVWSVRFLAEFLKQSQGGFESSLGILSTGQWLSIPLILFGFYLVFRKSESLR